MNQKVSKSVTGQNRPQPTREERDESFSSGAGRRAVEIPLSEDMRTCQDVDADDDVITCAPVGTELETQAREVDDLH